jgi:general secretion pathway protein E
VKPWKITGTWQPYRPVGCVDCRMTGFLGRMGLYELLTVSEAFKEQGHQGARHGCLRARASPTACGRCGWPAPCAWPRA